MLFVIDIGNSHTVTGIYENDNLIGTWRLTSDKNRTVDEIAIRYHTLFNLFNINYTEISDVIISSVVPKLEAAWLKYCEMYLKNNLKTPPFIVNNSSVANLVSIELDNPAEVGADRLVNAIAAWKRYGHNLVVIDFGTAITFDCVLAECRYIGGMILPGIHLSLEALSSKTAKLPQIDITHKPRNLIGKNTVEAMTLGALYGYGSMIDGVAEILKQEMGKNRSEQFKVLATGGMAKVIAPYSTAIDDTDTMLTLKGLKIIHDFNQQNA